MKAQEAFSQGLTLLPTYTSSKNFALLGDGVGNNPKSGNNSSRDFYLLAQVATAPRKRETLDG